MQEKPCKYVNANDQEINGHFTCKYLRALERTFSIKNKNQEFIK